MFGYILKLLIMLPLVAGMAWGSLWLWRRYQPGMMGMARPENGLAVVETIGLGATARVAVVRFGDAHVLVAISRSGIVKLAEQAVDHG
jgi:flagellar protein FliO/FliZ